MTLAELHERIGWQLEGRLQHLTSAGWLDWSGRVDSELSCPRLSDAASVFRRRPDAMEMPEEVWLSDNQKPEDDGAGDMYTAHTHMCGAEEWHGGKLVRYVRADAVIDGSRLQWRRRGCFCKWFNDELNEYRFKP